MDNIANVTFYRPQTKFAEVMSSQVSVCPRGSQSLSGGLCPGISVQRGVSLSRGSLSWGISVQGNPPGQRPPRQRPPQTETRTVTSGWYASYWNAFLLHLLPHFFCLNKPKSFLLRMIVTQIIHNTHIEYFGTPMLVSDKWILLSHKLISNHLYRRTS